MNPTRPRAVAALLCGLLLTAGAAGAAGDLWLHVRVEENAGETTVKVNLPLALFEKALPMIPRHHLGHAGEALDELHMEIADMRELWQEIRESPDMTFVTVEERDEKVRVWKEKGYLFVRVDEEEGDEVDVRVPEAVVDAFLSGEDGDVGAAVAALVESGGGELVRVNDRRHGDQVRVWIDDVAEAD